MKFRYRKSAFRIPRSIFEDELPSSAFVVLVFLFSESGEDGMASPGFDAIQRATRLSRPSVVAAMRILEKNDWFFFTKKGGNRRALYMLRVPPRLLGIDFPPPRAISAMPDL